MSELYTLTRAQGANRALIDGSVTIPGYSLRFADEPVLVKGFRKLVRKLENYDVAELALTTYLTAKEHGAEFTALPIFLVRGFHHGSIQVLRGGRVQKPIDLDGGRVGVSRGYTVTTGVWARAILASEYGVDLDSITWVLSGDEHVASYVPPANVEPAPEGRSLEELLLAGELDAVINADIDRPEVTTLFADPDGLAMTAVRDRGIFPINHLVVVQDSLLAEHPDLALALFQGFAEAKRRYIAEIRSGQRDNAQERMLARIMAETDSTNPLHADPMPYGIGPNRVVLDELMKRALDQHILTRPVDLADVFVPSTLDLIG